MLTRTKVLDLTIAALLILTLAPGPATAGAPALAAAPPTRTVEHEPFSFPAGEGPGVRATAAAENVEFVGHIGGSTLAVAVQGDYAYIGEGPRLTILDISNPASPTVVGKTAPLPGVVQGVAVAGGYAYVAEGSAGLRVVDVSDPTNPAEVGCYDTPGDAWGVAIAGGYAYVADRYAGLRVVDVSTPANPTEVGSYDTPGWAYGVAVAGGYAYVADEGSGLRVVDVSDPTNPTEVGSYDTPAYARGVAVAGGYVYVADAGGLRVVDVSTPANPTEVGSYDTPGNPWGVAVAGSYAYVADRWCGLRVVDVSTPANPMEVGFYDTPGWAWGVAVAGSYAYVADGDGGLRVVDVFTPANPTEVGSYDTPGWAYGVAVAGGYAYVADAGGLRVVNVSDPTNPTEVGFYDTPGSAEGVAVAGGYAYVAAEYAGLRVVDISTPANPTEVGSCDTPGRARGVAVAGNYAYVADGYDGFLRVVDVSDPTNPTEVGSYDTPGDAWGVAVAGGYAYVADWGGGLRVVDVSTPANPTEVGSYDTPNARGVAVQGGYAYVADGPGLRVVDVSDPTNPAEVGFYDTPGSHGVAVAGDYAYVAAGYDGFLRVVDVSDPTNPTEVGSYDTPGSAWGVAVAGGYAYVADGGGGLIILRFTGTGAITYDGPLYLPDDSVMVQEKDGKITMGDHVHLQLPFLNTGTGPVASETITITAASTQPAVTLYDGINWGTQAIVPLTPTIIAPGERGSADLWLYIENLGPDERHSLFNQAQIQVATSGGKWDVHLLLAPISFSASENDLLTSESCLHHPDNYRIQNYAQYAAGGPRCAIPRNDFDPDVPEQAVRHLVNRVALEFEYKDGVWKQRVADVLLLTKRGGYIGTCRDYADLTTGLLRSLGLPTRYVMATLFKMKSWPWGWWSGHAWAESYVSAEGWRQADSTWNTAFNEQIYEASGYTVKQAWADRYPLSSASIRVVREYRCIPSCYQQPVNCVQCSWESNRLRSPFNPDLSCVEDVTSDYHNVGSSAANLRVSGTGESLVVQIDAPQLVTRTIPFTVDATLVNSATQTLDVITATVSRYDQISSTVLLYDIAPAYHTVSDLAPGGTVTVTWTITPLVTGSTLPLRVGALGGEVFGMDERPLVVNEPGTPLPLTLNGCSPGKVQSNQPFTLTAYALGERLQFLTDTLTTVTATLYATPTLGYSTIISLTPDADGFFRRTVTLPADVPIGTYLVDFAAARSGYDPAEAATVFFVAPTLTITLETTPLALRQTQPLTLTARVYERGTPVDRASVWAEFITPSGVVTVPLAYGGGVYTTTLRPLDLAPNLDGSVRGGQWQITALAHYYGSTAEATETITVFRRIYLPLILRSH